LSFPFGSIPDTNGSKDSRFVWERGDWEMDS
jgi:hypothetical protein